MNLQNEMNNLELNITLPQMKAFFLGSMIGNKPLSGEKSISDFFNETEISGELNEELLKFWAELKKNELEELKKLFSKEGEFSTTLEFAKEQLDFFLTGLGLAGTSAESEGDTLLGAVLDELEELVLDMEDYLACEDQSAEETKAIEEDLQTLWSEFLKTRQ